jgi:hypothetical protein
MAAEIQAAQALIESLGQDADDAELVQDMIEGETNLYELIDRTYNAIREDQEMIDGISKREDELAVRKTQTQKRIDWRKAKIEQALLIFNDKITRPEATFSLRKNQPILEIEDESNIPTSFWKEKTEVKLDKTSLKNALKEGAKIDGAKLIEKPKSLSVRVR